MLRDAREFNEWLAGSAARGVTDTWAAWSDSYLAPLRDEGEQQVGGEGLAGFAWLRACPRCA